MKQEARYHVPQDKHPPISLSPPKPKLTSYAQKLLSSFTIPNKQTQYNPVNQQTSWEDTF